MRLADTFQGIVDALPDDWTDLTVDLRIFDEDRYVDAAVYLVQCNPQPYSKYDWHWRIHVSHRFGHSASAPTVHGTLKLLDDAVIVRSTIELGHNLGMEVVAEGVETAAAWNELSDLGCDIAQGYYLGRPLSQRSRGRRADPPARSPTAPRRMRG